MSRRIICLHDGDKFGRLTVVRNGRPRSLVRCECGTEREMYNHSLTSGNSKSCGCLQKELAAAQLTTHGHYSGRKVTPERTAWGHMMARCYRPSDTRFHRYGARGIVVCDRWHKFSAFYEDLGARPGPGHSLDRINNDGNYEPGNCRWATDIEQANNTVNVVRISADGVTGSMNEIARRVGIDRRTIAKRLKRGWTMAEAVGDIYRKPFQRREEDGGP